MKAFLRRRLRGFLDVLEVFIVLMAMPVYAAYNIVVDWLYDVREFFRRPWR